jgi:hypothetical protein
MIAGRNQPEVREPGMALVLASVYRTEGEKNALVKSNRFPRLRTSYNRARVRDHGARDSGAAYGNSVSLNRQVSGSSRARIGGAAPA